MACSRTENTEEINARGIRARMSDIISGEFKRLIKDQIDPWIFFNSKGVHVKKFGGGNISISGVKYNGSTSLVFWSYIKPYIEDIIKRMIEKTIELAKDKDVQISAVLGSTKANLSGGIDTVYCKMQDIDRKLRGKGYPESVPKRDVSSEIKQMNNFLDKQLEIYRNLTFQGSESWFKKWYQDNPHWVWLIGIVMGTGIIIYVIKIILRFIRGVQSSN